MTRQHVIPLNDEEEHTDKNCKCNTEIIKTKHGIIIKHRSFDCRELIESDNIDKN